MTWTAICQCGWDGPTTAILRSCPDCGGKSSGIDYADLTDGVSADSARAWLAEFHRRTAPALQAIDDAYFQAGMGELDYARREGD